MTIDNMVTGWFELQMRVTVETTMVDVLTYVCRHQLFPGFTACVQCRRTKQSITLSTPITPHLVS